jgi:hypothetical protein
MQAWAMIMACAAMIIGLWGGRQSYAASQADIDKLTTYATILGRASACGLESDGPSRRVGAWVDRTFSSGEDRKMAIGIFTQGAQYAAQMQAKGRTPDSCAEVTRSFRSMPWP